MSYVLEQPIFKLEPVISFVLHYNSNPLSLNYLCRKTRDSFKDKNNYFSNGIHGSALPDFTLSAIQEGSRWSPNFCEPHERQQHISNQDLFDPGLDQSCSCELARFFFS